MKGQSVLIKTTVERSAAKYRNIHDNQEFKLSSANLSQSPLTLHGHRFSACFREKKEIWGGSERRGWSQGD